MRRHRPASRRSPLTSAGLAVLLLAGALAGAGEPERPEILHVAVPRRLVAGLPGEGRLTYRAPGANVVAVILAVEDLDGARRVTSAREIGVVAAAFGREAGDLVVPVTFATPGWKRIVVILVTDEREESEPASIDVEVAP
jgi:hypothetical protein